MSTRERGAGLIWWVIILMVLTVVGGVGTYYNYDNHQKAMADVAEREQQIADLNDTLGNRNTWLKELSDVVGWSYTDVPPERPQADQVQNKVKELRDKFATVQASDTTLEKAIDAIVQAHDAAQQLATDTQANFDREVRSRNDLQAQKDAIESQKNNEIAQVQQQLSAERNRNSTNTAQLQGTIDQLRDRVSDLERQIATQAADAKKTRIDLTNTIVAKEAQMGQLRDRLVKMEREPNRPDGEVIDASSDLVWIDVGSKHGLKRGTRFNVFEYGKGRVKKLKGEVQVREVRSATAVCAVVSIMDRLNPIVSGDFVANPYFDSEKTPEFVLLGVMPGRFGNEEMVRLLEKYGATVSDTVSANTDFLVVGEKAASEEEEDGIPLEESDTFRMANQYGVEIITGRELEQLLRF